ncbi:MAG: hypothetical protein KR126chlam4_00812 [Candidatus Anoxychlamydiales bacterium]|nr:hypothetical protein [Candidatus Anoxychlamydiales bacterium]
MYFFLENWIVLSNIQGEKIRVKMDVISKRIEIVVNGTISKFTLDKALNKLRLEEQDSIITSLVTSESQHLEIIHTHNGYCPYAIPVGLKILNLS